MWYPNLVFTIGEICPFWRSKAAFSNSFTICPRPNVPRSPPRFLEGQSDSSLAIFENFSPFFNRSKTVFASFSVFTRMWAQWTLVGITQTNRKRFITIMGRRINTYHVLAFCFRFWANSSACLRSSALGLPLFIPPNSLLKRAQSIC